LEVPTCLLPNDVLKIIASIPTNNFGKVPELTITEHELMENHKHFNPYIIVCKYNGLSIIHSRKNNEYAPMHQIDYSIHDATFAFQTTVEDFYKLIGTKDKVITFKFPFPTFTGTLLKSNEQPLVEMHYDRELLIKALETFKTGTLCVMFKDTHAPLIMYNEKYVIYTKNMAYRRSED
jgi:hypothetical protein